MPNTGSGGGGRGMLNSESATPPDGYGGSGIVIITY
jgi:hypothetical protein